MADQSEGNSPHPLDGIFDSIEEVGEEQAGQATSAPRDDIIPSEFFEELEAAPEESSVLSEWPELLAGTTEPTSKKRLFLYFLPFLLAALAGVGFLLQDELRSLFVSKPATAPVTKEVAFEEPTPVLQSEPKLRLGPSQLVAIRLVRADKQASHFELQWDGAVPKEVVSTKRLPGEQPRLVVDVVGVNQPFQQSRVVFNGQRVQQVRTGLHLEPDKMRLVFDLVPRFQGGFDYHVKGNTMHLAISGAGQERAPSPKKPPGRFIALGIQQVSPRLQHCYEKALRTNDKLKGMVQLEFAINQKGNLTNLKILPSPTMKDAGLMHCMDRVLARLRMPKPGDGRQRFLFPLAFAPKKAPVFHN